MTFDAADYDIDGAVTVTHRSGAMEPLRRLTGLESLVGELDGEDPEHPDVAVSREDGWTLSLFPSGLVVFENIESSNPRHQRGVGRPAMLEMVTLLATGELVRLEALKWGPGYG